MVTDQSKLKKFTQQFPDSMTPNERVNLLTYRYYMVVPYQSRIEVMDDNSLFSETSRSRKTAQRNDRCQLRDCKF